MRTGTANLAERFPRTPASLALLLQGADCWHSLAGFRRERARCKRYTYGDQWGDWVDIDGEMMTEREYILRQGSVPLKNNLIRRLVRNVMGVYRSQQPVAHCVARSAADVAAAEEVTALIRANGDANSLDELNARALEEFLISGFAVQRKWYGLRDGVFDCWTDHVSPDTFFIDTTARDYRGWDTALVGQLHDLQPEELLGRFAFSEEECALLRNLYGLPASGAGGVPHGAGALQFGDRDSGTADFLQPAQRGLCRVVEIWRKERIREYTCHDPVDASMFKVRHHEFEGVLLENRQRRKRGERELTWRWTMEPRWRYYFLAPGGEVLASGDTPYAHGSHPYIYKAYPFIDGEIHSFVADVIDQQRYTNRLITLYDWIMRASAKGVLMVAEDTLGCMSPDDFADQWSRFNGVIFYRPRPGAPPPTQISMNSTNIGITELLGIQLKFFEDISGVSPSLQGKTTFSGMSGTLFSQQTQNATLSLLDIMETFSKFVLAGAQADLSNLLQFYSPTLLPPLEGELRMEEATQAPQAPGPTPYPSPQGGE